MLTFARPLTSTALAFGFWYASPQGDQANVVADVNGSMIMSTDYNREFRNFQRYQESRLQRTLSDEEQNQLGETVKDVMIDRFDGRALQGYGDAPVPPHCTPPPAYRRPHA